MNTKKTLSRLGAGTLAAATILAGLSFGPAAATAAPAEGRSISIDNVSASYSIVGGKLVFSGYGTPGCQVQQRGGALVASVNGSGTWSVNTGWTSWPGGAYSFWEGPGNPSHCAINIASVNVPRQDPPVAPSPNVGITQTAAPTLSAGATGTATLQFKNTGNASTGSGLNFTFHAPAGTLLTSGNVPYTVSGGSGATFAGTLSADRKSVQVNSTSWAVGAGATVAMSVELEADSPLTQSGDVNGTFVVNSGAALSARTVNYKYTAQQTPASVAISQTASPTLAAGETGTATLRFANNGGVATDRGLNYTVNAPAGTTLTSNEVHYSVDGGTVSTMTGTLAADRKSLVVDHASWAVAAGSNVVMSVDLLANTPLAEDGVVNGSLVVNSGAALSPRTIPLAYTAEMSHEIAPLEIAAPVNGSTVLAPTGEVVFSGTGEPGATVAVRGLNGGRVIGTTTVGANGQWTFTATNLNPDHRYVLETEYTVPGEAAVIGQITFTTRPSNGVTQPLSITTPAQNSTVITADGRVTFTGKGTTGATVVIRGQEGGRVIGTAVVGYDGNWAFTGTNLNTNMRYTLDTIYTLADGTVSNGTLTFTTQSSAGVTKPFTIAQPVEDSRVRTTNGQVAFSGTGKTGDRVVIKGLNGGRVVVDTIVDVHGNWAATGVAMNTDFNYILDTVYTPATGAAVNGQLKFTTYSADSTSKPFSITPGEGGTLSNVGGRFVFTGTGTTGDVITIHHKAQYGGAAIATGTVDAAGNWQAIGYGNPDYTYNVEYDYTHAGVTTTTAYTFTSVSTTN